MEDTPSVRRALAELQLKTRLLGEERDYYSTLFATSQASFEHHRRELGGLLAKERELFQRREAALQRELQGVLQENAARHSDAAQERARASARTGGALEALRREGLAEEGRRRGEAEALRREGLGLQADLAAARGEHAELQAAVAEGRAALEELQRDVQDTLAEQTACADPAAAPPGRPPRRRSGRPAFVAAGKATSHNASVLLQTAVKTNYRTPLATAGDAGQPTLLDDVTASLVDELQALRAEYSAVARCLPDTASTSSAAVRSLQALHRAIDQKTQQLQAVRKSQHRADTRVRLARLLDETRRKNDDCTGAYRALMETVRTAST